MISHVHHINFIVHDLPSAVSRYQKLLGLGEFQFDTLQGRNVITARIKLGDTWLVLVQPTDEIGAPAEYLKRHGEGFFLMSLATDDIESQLQLFEDNFQSTLESHFESTPLLDKPRSGLENWRVTDLPRHAFFGANFQLTQEKSN